MLSGTRWTSYGESSSYYWPPHYKSSLRVMASPALLSSKFIDSIVKAIETRTKPTANIGSAADPSIVASASETNTSRIIGETMIKLMIV